MTLALENTTVTVGEARLIDRVSLTLGGGEMVAVVGPNGAGKTTVLSALAGSRALNAGAVTLHGRDLGTWPADALAVQRAVLTQAPGLGFPFRVHEVVRFGRMPHRAQSSPKTDADIVDAAMRAADIAPLAERIFPTLSGGEQQRVHLARVLAQVWEPKDEGGPRFLLLDEPTSSLDLKHQHLTLRLAREFADAGGGVLTVLHDLNLAAAYADRIAVMQHGQCVATGAPHSVLVPDLIGDVFEMPVTVVPHPTTGHPCVLAGAEAPPPHRGETATPRWACRDTNPMQTV